MSEIAERAALALVDSPLTTKAVIAATVGTASGTFLNALPDILSIVGLIVAAAAGTLLAIRHRKAGKLDDERRKLDATRRKGAEMQNAHDAKMQALELERVQLELERYKAGDAV